MTIGTRKELMDFVRGHQDAWQFATKAQSDYLLARFGIMTGLWSAFEISTQAVEKLLKAYILFTSADVLILPAQERTKKMMGMVREKAKLRGTLREVAHDVVACLEVAESSGLNVTATTKLSLAKINDYYSLRYPDNDPGPQSLSSGDISEVDDVVFDIWDGFKAINEDYYYTAGISTAIYGFISNRENPISNTNHNILSNNNAAYRNRQEDFYESISKRITEWYSRK